MKNINILHIIKKGLFPLEETVPQDFWIIQLL